MEDVCCEMCHTHVAHSLISGPDVVPPPPPPPSRCWLKARWRCWGWGTGSSFPHNDRHVALISTTQFCTRHSAPQTSSIKACSASAAVLCPAAWSPVEDGLPKGRAWGREH